ncbi:MAG: FIST signal transduction protein [Bacteroidia bacterium]
MKIAQRTWQKDAWSNNAETPAHPNLCLIFGSRPTLEANPQCITQITSLYPNITVVTSSTAGNIMDEYLSDDSIIATLIEFEKTTIKTKLFELNKEDDKTIGKNLATYFDSEDLAYIILLSCAGINAGNLLLGINETFKGRVPVSGGVAGDDTRFERTLVGLNNNIGENQLVAIGFYGRDLKVSHGSKGGWDQFGPLRKITKCKGNVLFEIDNRPVLDLYKEYLGEKASELPASGLLFPFAIIDAETQEPVVRGIQNVDEATKSIILYGDVEEGMNIQLMRANFDNLISGAGDSAKETFLKSEKKPELAILISCIARRLVLGQLTEEELTETRKVFGPETTICGFYSYSELSPVVGDNACHLHNQTMTITTLSEN